MGTRGGGGPGRPDVGRRRTREKTWEEARGAGRRVEERDGTERGIGTVVGAGDESTS